MLLPLPASRVRMPVVLREPAPDLVPEPAVVRVIPPLAVVVPLTVMLLPELVVTDRAPEPRLIALN